MGTVVARACTVACALPRLHKWAGARMPQGAREMVGVGTMWGCCGLCVSPGGSVRLLTPYLIVPVGAGNGVPRSSEYAALLATGGACYFDLPVAMHVGGQIHMRTIGAVACPCLFPDLGGSGAVPWAADAMLGLRLAEGLGRWDAPLKKW
jgi:hypothetical protein